MVARVYRGLRQHAQHEGDMNRIVAIVDGDLANAAQKFLHVEVVDEELGVPSRLRERDVTQSFVDAATLVTPEERHLEQLEKKLVVGSGVRPIVQQIW